MMKIPDEIRSAWDDREGPIVLTTVDNEDVPNSIYVLMFKWIGNEIAIADNYFDKTYKNIILQSNASILFITKSRKAYQLKGKISYFSKGAEFNDMLQWADPKHPRKGVAYFKPDLFYNGREQIN
jgi:hypothetical protein